jgi:hypothetical protein
MVAPHRGWANSCFLEHYHPETQLSKRPGDQIAYISVGSVGYSDVVIVLHVVLLKTMRHQFA